MLAASSKYFLDSVQTSNEIDLSQMDKETLNSILEFVYTGETNTMTKNEAKFLEFAEALKIHGLPKKLTSLPP